MTPYHDPFAASLALARASGYAVAAQMRCATVLARSAMDFATLRPWMRALERSGSAPEPQGPPKARRRQPAARSKAAPKAQAPRAETPKPRLVASSDGPAPSAGKGSRRQPSAPPAMPAPERAATGTGEA